MFYRKILNLKLDPFNNIPKEYYDIDLHKDVGPVWNKRLVKEDLGTEFSDWFDANGLKFRDAMLFSYMPFSRGFIHIDDYDCETALNFSKGSPGLIQWFDGSDPITGTTDVGKTKYIKFDELKCKILETHVYTDPVLVKVNIPHRGINLGQDMRYTVSVRWTPYMTIEESENLLSKGLKNE